MANFEGGGPRCNITCAEGTELEDELIVPVPWPAVAPETRSDAVAHLAMGSVVRVVLRFTERFWASKWFGKHAGTEELDTMSFLHTSDRDFPVWWTVYPLRAPMMVAWRGGVQARALSQLASEEVGELSIASLAHQLGVAPRKLRGLVDGIWMHDWEHDPFSRGAYSYQIVGGSEAPAALARPLRGTLFFAGEAADPEGRTGTVHGAIATGKRAAAEVLKVLRD